MPPRTVLPSNAELLRMRAQDVPVQAIADQYEVTPQAVYYRLNQAKGGTVKDRLLPWQVQRKHQGSIWHRCARAHAKWANGEAVTKEEKADATSLRDTAALLKSVLLYDPEVGFHWRDRTPDDVDILAVPE